jgi:hypothetical protein
LFNSPKWRFAVSHDNMTAALVIEFIADAAQDFNCFAA